MIGSDPKTNSLCYGLAAGREEKGWAYLQGAPRRRRTRRRPGEGPDEDQGTWRRAAALAPVVAARKKAPREIEGEREKEKAAKGGGTGERSADFF